MCRRAPVLTLNHSTIFLPRRSPRCGRAPSDSPLPTFSRVRSGVALRSFSPLATDDVINAVRRLPDKSSAADPIPTSLLKQVADLVAPFIVELFNRSLAAGYFPAAFKEAFVTPIVKKSGLDATDVSSYRPISNLSVLSTLLERLVLRQLMKYLTSATLLTSCRHYNLDFARAIRLRQPSCECFQIFCSMSIVEI